MKSIDERQGITKDTLGKAIADIKATKAQISSLEEWLKVSQEEPEKLKVNPVDLRQRQRETVANIERLRDRLQSITEATIAQAKRSWTEHGDFSTVQSTGVVFNNAK